MRVYLFAPLFGLYSFVMRIHFFVSLFGLYPCVMRASSFDRKRSFSQKMLLEDKVAEILSMSNPEFYVNRCVPNVTENEFDLRERLLDLVIHGMKSFIGETSFNRLEFEDLAEILEQQILYVGHSVNPFAPCTKHLYDKLQFARHIFQEMRDAVESLNFMDSARGQAQTLVNKVILLNIRLLSFFDSKGKPDSQAKGYSYKITRLTHALQYWGRSFRRMKLVSRGVMLVFETYSSQAFFTLEELASHIRSDS